MALNIPDNIDYDCANDDQYLRKFPIVKLRFSPTITILVYIIYLLPFCFGVFGNISVCLIFFQQKKLRSITNTFLMNLCLNDLIVLCVSIPMTLSAALLEHWVFGAFLCKFVNFAPTLTALVSTFTVAIIAVERWLFIVNKKKFDRRCTIVTLISLWLVSTLIALPEFLSRQLEEFAPPPIPYSMLKNLDSSSFKFNNNNTNLSALMMMMMKPSCQTKKVYFCVLNPGLRMRIFSYIVITVQYLVPFLFVSISCYSISRFLKRRMKQMRVYQVNRPININKKKKKVKIQQKKSPLDEIIERELPNYDKVPITIVTNENKSNYFLTRFRQTFKNREHYQDSIVLDRQNYRSSSIVGTVLMPTVKSQSHSKRRFHRSRKLLICVAALFTISWLPLTVVQIYLEHNEEVTRDDSNFVYGFLLIPCYLISSLSAWMNPVIYNYINHSFRREFYALYPCCCKSPSTSAYPRTEIPPSVIANRSRRQELRNTEENPTVLLPRTTNKSGTRFVTFADGEKKGQTSLVMINEQV